MKLLAVKPSSRPQKKVMAVFYSDDKRIKIVHFGDKNYQDYTSFPADVRDEKRDRYLRRHNKSITRWADDPTAPATLARWILWGDSPSFRENVKAFKQKFNL